MEFVVRFAAPTPYVPAARRRVLALVERDGPLCAWCGLEASLERPAGHPAAPVAAPECRAAPEGLEGLRLAHRFCADPANRKFDLDDPAASTLVRRARLAFAVEAALTSGASAARRWRRFELGSDRPRTTAAHLRGMRRLGVRVRFADVAAVVAGPLLHRLYLARMRRWSRRPLQAASGRQAEVISRTAVRPTAGVPRSAR